MKYPAFSSLLLQPKQSLDNTVETFMNLENPGESLESCGSGLTSFSFSSQEEKNI